MRRLRTATRLKTEVNAGRVAGVFGLRGELKLAATRIGADALAAGMTVTAVLTGGATRTLRVRSIRLHQGRPLVAFDGVDDATAAETLAGAQLTIARDDAQLARDEYFDDDLIGCTLIDPAGRELATVTGVEHYPAQDILRVDTGDQENMVPMVRSFIRSIDLSARRITVELPPGLLEGNAEEA